MKCKYGHNSPQDARFCSTCGATLFEDDSKESLSAQKKKSDIFTDVNLIWFQKDRKRFLTLGTVALVLLSLATSILNSEKRNEITQTDYMPLLKQDTNLEMSQLEICERLKGRADILAGANAELLEKINSYDGATTDGRIAAEFLRSTPLSTSEKYLEKFRREIQTVVINALSQKFTADLSADLQKMLTNDSILLCERQSKWATSEKIIDQESAATTLDAAVSAIVAGAKSVPWYSEGFEAFNSEIAIRYLSTNEYSCDFSFGNCASIDVITKFGCSDGLYAESNLMNNAGVVVDWSNDTLPYLAPNQIANLKFAYGISVSGGKFEVTEINCY